MERKFTFSEGEYYHVYNRGVDKRDIFLDEADRRRFHRMLRIANGTKPVVYKLVQRESLDKMDVGDSITALGAYVLMGNHFHLLLKETKEKGVSAYMEKLLTGYSKYFNKKYGRSGALFQGPFRAQHVDRDEYLKYLFAYIHLNPVKLIDPGWKENGIRDRAAAKKYLAGYQYSSYPDYMGVAREESAILDRKEFPEYFSGARDFDGLIDDWLSMRDEEPGLAR